MLLKGARVVDPFINTALDAGAFGIKLLGGMTPNTPELSASILRRSYEAGAYIAWHAGSTEHGSNIEGMKEVIDLLGDMPLHLAHINAYCRGGVRNCGEEAQEAIDMLRSHPQVISESYLSPMNGMRLAVNPPTHFRAGLPSFVLGGTSFPLSSWAQCAIPDGIGHRFPVKPRFLRMPTHD